MKILLINNFLYNRGGDCTYMFSLGDLLKSKNHNVSYWGMKHPKNFNFSNENFFVDDIDYSSLNNKKNIKGILQVLSRSIYSKNAKKSISNYIDNIKPDIVHLNNIHAYLTPSIIDEIHKRRIPIVWTLHDFKLLCPDSHFLSNNKICEKCKDNKFYNCAINTCKKSSFSASLMASFEAYTHLFLDFKKKVSRYIAPSNFLRNKFIDYGYSSEKIIYLKNFIFKMPEYENINTKSNYILYFGGLNQWKGIKTLLNAMSKIKSPIKLKIVGNGEMKSFIEKYISKFNINNIELYDFMSGQKLNDFIANSQFVIVPSECYENCPYSIMEAMSLGKPIIASNIGGIPELVHEGKTGILFNPFDSDDLCRKIVWLFNNPAKIKQFSKNSKIFAQNEFNSSNYYNELINIYDRVLN